ncbi:hypothetical protein [Acidisoma sp. 7E03]
MAVLVLVTKKAEEVKAIFSPTFSAAPEIAQNLIICLIYEPEIKRAGACILPLLNL